MIYLPPSLQPQHFYKTQPPKTWHLHLADAFIQSDLHCIQVTVFFYILSALAFPGNRTHDLGVASACSTIWATAVAQMETWTHKMSDRRQYWLTSYPCKEKQTNVPHTLKHFYLKRQKYKKRDKKKIKNHIILNVLKKNIVFGWMHKKNSYTKCFKEKYCFWNNA